MNKTCFLCRGNNAKEDALVYQEIPRKSRGEEFFVFISPSDPAYEPLSRRIFRSIIALSRLGHPGQFFARIIEIIGSCADTAYPDSGFLAESKIVVVLKREKDFYVLRNKGVEILYRNAANAGEGEGGSIPGLKEYALGDHSGQVELFESSVEDFFRLEMFRLVPGTHTVLFIPSREFAERYRETLMNSVFFPSFEIRPDGIEVRTDHSFPGIHWNTQGTEEAVMPAKTRSRTMIRKWIPYTTGALAALAALLIIFRPFGGNDAEDPSSGMPLLTAQDDAGAGEDRTDGETGGLVARPSEAEETVVEEPVTGGGALAAGGISLSEGWMKKFDAPVTSSPFVSAGMVIFGCRDGNLYSFSTEGELQWRYAARQGVGASPCVVGNRVIGADYEGNVFCIDRSTGQRIWNYLTGTKIVSSPRADGDLVVVGTTEGELIGISLEDGKRRWSKKLGDGIWATSSLGRDYIISATTDGALVRLDRSGEVRWRVKPGGEIYSSPLVMEEKDLVVFGTGERFVFGYSLSGGNLMWRSTGGSDLRSSAVTDGRYIYIGSEDGVLYALDQNGTQIWKKDVGGAIRSKPLLFDNYVIITTYGSRLKVYDKTSGDKEAEYRVESPVYSSPATDGVRIFFGSNQGFMHAVNMQLGNG